MNTMLHFLTDLALQPSKQEAYRKNAPTILKTLGMNEISPSLPEVQQRLASELKTEEFASVGGMLCTFDPGPDPAPDPDPPGPWD